MQPAVLRDVFLDIISFPIWWYSRGLVLMFQGSVTTLRGYARYFAIEVWIKNIFVPMFGQHDWQSRLISVFMRLVQIIGRSLALVVVTLGIVLVSVLYLVAPVAVMLLLAYNVMGSLLYVL